MRRLLHRLITLSVSGRFFGREKVTITDFFYSHIMDGGMLVDVPWQVARFLAEKAKGAQKKSRILGAHLICRITGYFNLTSGAALSAMVDEMLDDGDEEDEAAEVRRAKDENEGGVNFMSGPQSFPSSSTTPLADLFGLFGHPENMPSTSHQFRNDMDK
ncbi:hypothetical protein Tco_0851595 [Tanacetum coccineum]